MPRDVAGTYTLPAGNPVIPNTIISTTWANNTLDDVAAALTASLSIDGSVITAKIADLAVTTAKLNTSAVTTAKIADANVTTAKIADANVTTAKIADANVTGPKINDLAVSEAKLATSAVATAKIADDAVTPPKIVGIDANGFVTRTSASAFTTRSVTGTANQITVTNGDGVSGAPTLTLSSDLRIPSQVTRIVGSGSGDANISFIGFYESDGTTRRGFIGDAGSDGRIYLSSDSGDIVIAPNSNIVLPGTGNVIDLGSNALNWKHIYAQGIRFPVTQAPSADANMLDDYEEGTFTPTITYQTVGNLTVVYSTRVGNYTKIGRQVTVSAVMVTSTYTHTTSSGEFRLGGLPFVPFDSTFIGSIQMATFTMNTGRTWATPVPSSSGAWCVVTDHGDGVSSGVHTSSNHTSGVNSQVRYSVVYEV